MKYSPDTYAKAFAAAAAELSGKDAERRGAEMAENLVRLAVKNRDAHLLPKILAAAERIARNRSGIRKVKIVSARPLTEESSKILGAFLKPRDAAEYAVDPSLIAGIKIIVNDAEAFDGSLVRKMNKLFTNH